MGVCVILQIIHTDPGWLKATSPKDAADSREQHQTTLCQQRALSQLVARRLSRKGPQLPSSPEKLLPSPQTTRGANRAGIQHSEKANCVYLKCVCGRWEKWRKPHPAGSVREVKYGLVEFSSLNSWELKCEYR